MRKTAVLLTLALLLTGADGVPFHYYRAYQPGDFYRYALTVRQEIDGRFDTEETATSRHVVFGGQATGEEVSWDSLILVDREGRKDLSALAQKVPTMRLSLAPGWRNQIPEINVPAMRGMITDLYTFYVAISDGSGVRRLRRPGDVYESPGVKRGQWSDDRFVPVGEDCTVLTLKLNSFDRETARLTSDFQPTREPCMQMKRSWMSTPVVPGTPNNFQTVRRDADGYTIIWGLERFTIETELDTQSGAIRDAKMDNTLNVRMRRGCDAEYANCQPESAFVIHRRAGLQRR